MTRAELEKIIDERLANYRRRMLEENATPLICLGVSHGDKSGQHVLCCLEDWSNAQVADWLECTLRAMGYQKIECNRRT